MRKADRRKETNNEQIHQHQIHQQYKVVIEFSKKREHGYFTLRMFVRLKLCVYKKARQNRQESVVRIQSAFCEVASEQNSRFFIVLRSPM